MPYEKPAHLMDLDEPAVCAWCGDQLDLDAAEFCSALCRSSFSIDSTANRDAGLYDTIQEREDDR